MRTLFLAASLFALAACGGPATVGVDSPANETVVEPTVETVRTTPTLADIADPKLTVESVRPNLDVLFGPGGNIGVLYGANGALLVDDKFEANADEILARVAARDNAAPAFVLNTHYHGDHTGSNAAMKAAGATIIAHEGVIDLMSRDIENQLFNATVEARDPSALPQETFSESMALDFAGQTLQLVHVPAAHTAGDLLVHFPDSDVVHMGDNFFNGMNPYIDIDAGGSLQGMIAAQKAGVDLAGPDTVVIPGHGPLTDREGLLASHDRLVEIRDRMQARVDAGDTLDDVLAADIYADIGIAGGFISNENLARTAYRSLTQ